MRTYEVAMRMPRGQLLAHIDAPEDVPTGLILQSVMSHVQLLPHLVAMNGNAADQMIVATPPLSGVLPRPGLTIGFTDGVSISGPMEPSPVGHVPPEFDGRQITFNWRVALRYTVDPGPPTVLPAVGGYAN